MNIRIKCELIVEDKLSMSQYFWINISFTKLSHPLHLSSIYLHSNPNIISQFAAPISVWMYLLWADVHFPAHSVSKSLYQISEDVLQFVWSIKAETTELDELL